MLHSVHDVPHILLCVIANGCEQAWLHKLSLGYEEYESIRREAMKHFPAPHVTIYLDATPEQCFSRIQNRGRVSTFCRGMYVSTCTCMYYHTVWQGVHSWISIIMFYHLSIM